jgi:transposase
VQQNTVFAEFLGLAGVQVETVEREADGSWTVHVVSAPGSVRCRCPGCGGVAGRVKETRSQTLRHLVVVPMRVTWHKSIFECGNGGCVKASFAGTGPLAGAGAGVTEQVRAVMGHLVGDWLVPVSRVAAAAGVSWHTAHEGLARVAAGAGIVVTDAPAGGPAGVETGAVETGAVETGAVETGAVEAVSGSAQVVGLADRVVWSVTGVLPPVEVLGIDDHRCGRPLYHRDPVTGAWVADADRWQSVFVDGSGGHGLLGQVEGRAGADVIAWLQARDAAWRQAVRYVTIGMSSVYKGAVTRSGLLPNARLVVDVFHVAQLANTMVADVRRRVTFERYGRRGRSGDPEYQIKNLLVPRPGEPRYAGVWRPATPTQPPKA